MAKLQQGYITPKVLVISIENDIVTKSDGSDSGEALMFWADAWGSTIGGGN